MLVMLIQSVGSQPPPPHNHYLATTLPHHSLHAWTSRLMHAYHVTLMSASCSRGGWVWACTMGSLIILCSHYHHHHFSEILAVCVSFDIYSPGVYILTDLCGLKKCWMQNTKQFKKKIHMLICRFLLSQRLHAPLYISSFLSCTYALPILLQHIHFHSPLIFEGCLPFSPLWRMNGLVSGAILCPSRRSGVCAASHWSSKWADNGAGGPAC